MAPPGNIPSAAASTFRASRNKNYPPVGRHAVAEEALMDQLSRDSGFLVNGIFAKSLFRGINVNLHVNEFEAGIHFLMDKFKERDEVFWAFITRFDAEINAR